MEAYLQHLTLMFKLFVFVSDKCVVYTKYFHPPEQYYTLRPGSPFGFNVKLSLWQFYSFAFSLLDLNKIFCFRSFNKRMKTTIKKVNMNKIF